jgi:hypothetical protein
MFYRLSASRQQAELLEMLFPDGVEHLPRLSQLGHQAYTLNALAQGYLFSGQPGRAAPLHRRQISIREKEGNLESVSIGLNNLSDNLRLAGALCESEAAARRALVNTREQSDRFWEAVSLYGFGLTLSARGAALKSKLSLWQSLRMCVAQSITQTEGVAIAFLAQRALWFSDFDAELPLANRAGNWLIMHATSAISSARRVCKVRHY